jgi:hypothetical protein
MSSAILYLAIIAIWAGLLIPRWLKRDSPRGAALETDEAGTDEAATDGAGTDEAATAAPEIDEAGLAAPETGPARPARAEVRQRILKARRRMLWMMLGLTVAGGALAGTGLAAWWVIAPPAVMLAGYLLLLREAAKADAEVGQRDREAYEARQATRARGRARHSRHSRARAQATEVAPAVSVGYAAAPVPADYDDAPGRDFTLGHQYEADDDDAYEEYPENRLRAVGD